jgi:hypothetical protein
VTRLLNAGVDSLYLSARAEVGEWFVALRSSRTTAEAVGKPVPYPEIDGFRFDVLPHGRNAYPVVLRSEQLTILVTDRRNRPTFSFQLGSAFIQTVGVDVAWKTALRLASSIAGVTITDVKVSRIDIFADFADWRLYHSDLRGLIRHAKPRTYGEPEPGQFETIQVGTTPLLVRLYRKDLELKARGGFADVFWGGYEGPVVRVEVQASSDHLRRYGFGSVERLLCSLGDIWRYATSEFVRLLEPGDGRQEFWPERSEWAEVRRVGFDYFVCSGAVPGVLRAQNRDRLDRLLFGCLTSLGAYAGVGSQDEVLLIVPVELGIIGTREDFARAIERKQRKWSRGSWSRAVDSASASAGAWKETPCAPEPSQLNTRTAG